MSIQSHPHWRFLFRHRRSSLRKTEQEIFAGQVISLAGSILAGTILEITKLTLTQTVGVFLILPGVFDLGGSVAGAFGAKINHSLNQKHPLGRSFVRGLLYSLMVVGAASLILGGVGGLLGRLIFGASLIGLLILTVVSALVVALIGLPLVGSATILTSRLGLDADNFIGPVQTSVFDTLTVVVIYGFLKLWS